RHDPNAARRSGQMGRIRLVRGRRRCQQVDAAMLEKGLANADALPVSPRIGGASAPGECRDAPRLRADSDPRRAFPHQVAVRTAGAIRFEHREFGVVGRAALTVAKDMGELPDARQPGDEQLLHREFRRGMQIAWGDPSIAEVVKLGCESLQMRLESWAY